MQLLVILSGAKELLSTSLNISFAALRMTVIAVLLAACAPRHKTEVIPTLSGPARPFSPAVKANGFIFLSGQIGTDSTGRVVAGGIQAETRQTMNNIRDVLARAGSSFDKVVKCTVFIQDMAEWPAMNA